MNCSSCNTPLNTGARFCSHCGAAVFVAQPGGAPIQTRLVRPRYGRVIAGVCAGFAQQYGWDVVLVRIAVSLLVLFGCGTPLLAYIIAWIVMPNEPLFIASQPTAQPTA